jgi:DNA topoisomerase-1
VVRVGRYGPYVTGEVDGAEASANIPEDIAPADLTRERIEELLREGRKGAETLGTHPELGMEMLLKRGPYGPYLQLGDDEQEGRPRRMSLPKDLAAADVTPGIAASLLSLPRKLGEHPESGKQIEASIGRFGPSVKHDRVFASLPKDEDVLTVGFERALELIRRKEDRNRPLRTLGEDPSSGAPVEVREGRYGPYVTDGSINASLKKEQDPQEITLEQALKLISERAADPDVKKRKPRGKAKAAGKAAKGSARGAAKKARKPAAPKRPKATLADLEPFVGDLPAEVAAVVTRVEGIGVVARPAKAVAAELGLSEEEVKKLHKSGMFRLRMAFGKMRTEREAAAGQAG